MKKNIFVFAALLMVAFITIAWIPIGTGIAPVIRDQLSELRYMPDDPGTYAEFREEFWEFPVISTTGVWDSTSIAVDAGSLGATVDSLNTPGILKITIGNTSKGPNNGWNLQTNSAPFRINASPAKPDSATVPIEYECRVKFSSVGEAYLYAGLTIEDETLVTGQTYGIFFVKHDNHTSGQAAATSILWAKEIKDSVSHMDSASCGTISNNTWYRLKIVWNGKAAKFYVNDVYKTVLSTTANQPIGVNLKPTLEVAEGDSTLCYAYCDYIWAKQKR